MSVMISGVRRDTREWRVLKRGITGRAPDLDSVSGGAMGTPSRLVKFGREVR